MYVALNEPNLDVKWMKLFDWVTKINKTPNDALSNSQTERSQAKMSSTVTKIYVVNPGDHCLVNLCHYKHDSEEDSI